MALGGSLGQIARRVENLESARRFFGERLGLRELFAFPPLAFFDLGGTRLMLSECGKREPADILYFKVDAIAEAVDELSLRGVTFTDAPHMIHRHADGTEEWMAFLRDNEQRFIAIMAQVKPGGPAVA